MTNLVIMKDKQAVTSSLNVSGNFDKEHKNVLRDIENVKKDVLNFELMFVEGSEPDYYGRDRKVYYMNRKGFMLLVMGYTGKKAMQFKSDYIDAFDAMEQEIKSEIDTAGLSTELQMFGLLGKALAKQELATKQLQEQNKAIENKVDGISELLTMDTKDWRKEVNGIIRKIAIKQGGFDKFKEIGNESYVLLEDKARCSLTIRLENRKKNMIAQGIGKSTIKRLNKLDIIAEDHRLKEIYVSVVKNMAIKYGIWEDSKNV